MPKCKILIWYIPNAIIINHQNSPSSISIKTCSLSHQIPHQIHIIPIPPKTPIQIQKFPHPNFKAPLFVFVKGALSVCFWPELVLVLVLLERSILLLLFKVLLLLVSVTALIGVVVVLVFPPPIVESIDVLGPEIMMSGTEVVFIPEEVPGSETECVYVDPAELVVIITTGVAVVEILELCVSKLVIVVVSPPPSPVPDPDIVIVAVTIPPPPP